MPDATPLALDHLVLATPDLAATTAAVGAALGVVPSAGGVHVGMGTRNTLLALGDGRYLEIIGVDPDQPAPSGPRPFGIDGMRGPRLLTWAARTTDIDARVGGSYRITFLGKQKIPFSVSGDYRRVQPFETLAFTWTWEDSDMDVGETLVTLQLTEQGDSTELVLTHELLPAGDKRDEHEHGWNAILDSFAVYAAKPE